MFFLAFIDELWTYRLQTAPNAKYSLTNITSKRSIMGNIFSSTQQRFELLPNQQRLESLPNEVLIEIFQYIDSINLRSFKGLNKRIDLIIESLKINVKVHWMPKLNTTFLSTFKPSQIIRLEMRSHWFSMNLTSMMKLRSLILDCSYLSRDQLDQMSTITLCYLERLSVHNTTPDLQKLLLDTIFRGEHFPLLKICQLKLKYTHDLKLNDNNPLPNNTVRSLTINNKWSWHELESLLHRLPHLRRLETNIGESYPMSVTSINPHLSIKHLRITLNKPSDDLKTLLKLTPNLVRLRIRGSLKNISALEHFKEITKVLSDLVPRLQYFDCELYCYSCEDDKALTIRCLHPLYRDIQRLCGQSRNQCYATDINNYPTPNEYECEYFDETVF
ncbi:unnamed protein product [Adineta steineri]|uniref:F-box domain-containing protein n=1 Tax=Adineta steineri TaxID=433720 RepID=A0A815GT39_9BILA|nr:unnamed protein product [Adineta steineri]CAF4204770.1 unnamed protein product [Adineta steineri]